MNNIKLNLLLIVITGVLSSCSFSKTENKKINTTPNTQAQKLTSVQESILFAIEQNDIKALNVALRGAKPSDLFFEGFEKTPMGTALKYNFFEITQELIKKKIAPYSLGSHENVFRRNSFFYSLRRIHNHVDLDDQEIDQITNTSMNKSEKYLLAKVRENIKGVFSSKNKDKAALINQMQMPCYLFETQTILLNLTGNSYETLVKNLDCRNPINLTEVNELYELELFRGFKNLYTNTEFLSFLSRHTLLKSLMLKLNNFEFYISPSLLFKISRSVENYALNESFCKLLEREESLELCGVAIAYYRRNDFMKDSNIPYAPFEVIHSSDEGRTFESLSHTEYVPGSHGPKFILFDGEDTNYALVSIIMNGLGLSNWEKFYLLNEYRHFKSGLSPIKELSFNPGEYLNKNDQDGNRIIKPLAHDMEPLEDFESF